MIKKYRRQIDGLDKKLIGLLEKRIKVSKKLLKYKRGKDVKARDKKREKEIVGNLTKKSKLDKKLISKFYGLIFKFSLKK